MPPRKKRAAVEGGIAGVASTAEPAKGYRKLSDLPNELKRHIVDLVAASQTSRRELRTLTVLDRTFRSLAAPIHYRRAPFDLRGLVYVRSCNHRSLHRQEWRL